MSRTGILSITTPISITSPLNTQTLVHDGVAFVNATVPTISILQHDAISVSVPLGINITAQGGVIQVVYTTSTPTSITLSPGTYTFRSTGLLICSVSGLTSFYFVKIGGSGTFTSTFYSNSKYTGDSTNGELLAIGDTLLSFDGLGTLVVSTASVTLAMAASSVVFGNVVTLNSLRFNTIRIA